MEFWCNNGPRERLTNVFFLNWTNCIAKNEQPGIHLLACLILIAWLCLSGHEDWDVFGLERIIFELTNPVNTGGENHELGTCYIYHTYSHTYGLNNDASIFIVVEFVRWDKIKHIKDFYLVLLNNKTNTTKRNTIMYPNI